MAKVETLGFNKASELSSNKCPSSALLQAEGVPWIIPAIECSSYLNTFQNLTAR